MVESLCHHWYQCHEGSCVDSQLYWQREEDTQVSVVLTEEDEHCLIEGVYIAEGRLLR